MFKRKKVFILLRFFNSSAQIDYPKHLPIPQKGDVVLFNEHAGKVELIKHSTSFNITQIIIECGPR